MIAAELVNLTAGLIGAKHLMDAAIATAQAGGVLPGTYDFAGDTPRPTPFTDALGAELLILDVTDLDALMTLRGNLAITKMEMDEISSGKRQFWSSLSSAHARWYSPQHASVERRLCTYRSGS